MPSPTLGAWTYTEQQPRGQLLVSPRSQIDFLLISQASISGHAEPGAVPLHWRSDHRPLIADLRLKSPLKLPSTKFSNKGRAPSDEAVVGHVRRELSAIAASVWGLQSLAQGVEEGCVSAIESAVKEVMLNTAGHPVGLRKRLDKQRDLKELDNSSSRRPRPQTPR